jgi:hypothetical protein
MLLFSPNSAFSNSIPLCYVLVGSYGVTFQCHFFHTRFDMTKEGTI